MPRNRGALLEQVLRTYAPDLVLTRQQTNDPAVHARFNAREIPLNRWRNSEDRRYFEVALCMVRLQPELSVRLVRSELGSSQQSMLQRAVIERARACVGDARRVRVDPTQFRMYIGDAVYRWTVAAQGVESLIPLGRD